MNLLERLQQGQTLLSAGSFPNDAPINDPQSGFTQDNSPENTYEDETVGQFNNGSVLSNTLDNTGLDITNFTQTTGTPPPTYDWVTNYPPLASGEFNGAPSLYGLAYAAENTYLDNVSIGDPNSPQLSTLAQTGLDNTNANAEGTTIIPNSISYPNNYPPLASGKFDGAPEQYDTPYNLDNTYLEDVPIKDSDSPQIPTLSEINPPTPWSAPTAYPGNALGKWRGPSTNFTAPWSYGFPYEINLFNNLSYVKQQDTLDKTALDNTIPQSISTTNPIPDSNSYPNNYPALVSGEFNNAPSQYSSPYNPDNTYLDVISIQDSNSPQNFSLANTGLDNTNPLAAPSAIIPNDISYPNNYPTLVSGEFNGAPSQYTSPYNSENPYLNSVPIQDPNSPQIPTLEQTGLDNTDTDSTPTTIIPNNISYPNEYPAIEGVNLGVFNGAPNQYNTVYSPTNTYLNNVPIESETSRQIDTVLSGETGLDNTIQQSFITATVPNNITSPTNYPEVPQTNLGEFNGAPSQYATIYTPNSTYLDQYSIIVNEANPQIDALQRTGMDVENELYDEVAIFPANPDNITLYPAQNVTANTLNNVGEAPRPFSQIWKPVKRYYNDYIKPLKDQNLV
jgi:hypothetical protein